MPARQLTRRHGARAIAGLALAFGLALARADAARAQDQSVQPAETSDFHINANKFGAIGDGRTDDTGALQAALDRVPPSGQAVYVPAGTYSVRTTLMVRARTYLYGAGRGITILKLADGANAPLMRNVTRDAGQITISHLTIDGNQGHQTNNTCYGIEFGRSGPNDFSNRGPSGCFFSDVEVAHCRGAGVMIWCSDGFKAVDSYFCDNVGNARASTGGLGICLVSTRFSSIVNCVANHNTLAGIEIAHWEHIPGGVFNIISGNHCFGNATGIEIDDGGEDLIVNNICFDNKWAGINFFGGPFVFSGNRIGNSEIGILSQASDNSNNYWLVIGNMFTGIRNYKLRLSSPFKPICYGNTGLATENSGAARIGAGLTSVKVLHGLDMKPEPSGVQVTPLNNLGRASKFWVGEVTDKSLTIRLDRDPGGDGASFAWHAKY